MCATDAAFHLVHKIDVEHTLARLAHYEALNKAHIAQHQQQREQESAQQDEADAVARHERMRRAQQVREEQEREQLEQDADEKALVAALEEGRDIDDAMREREARREARVAAAQQRELATVGASADGAVLGDVPPATSAGPDADLDADLAKKRENADKLGGMTQMLLWLLSL